MLETESRYRHKDSKRLYYLSMEFLMGRSLGDNLSNLRVEELCREVLAGFGVSLDEVLDSENDAGLGNGGLGRLAACFLESMATLGMPGFGYGIDYEYGLFRQEIFNGFQREKPDRWKANGTPFQIEHLEEAVNIPLYGKVDGPREVEHSLEQTWSRPEDRGRHSDGHADRRLSRPDRELAAAVHGARVGRLRHRNLQPRRLHSRRRAEDPVGKYLARALSLRLGDERQGTAPGAGIFPGRLRHGRHHAPLPPAAQEHRVAAVEGRHPDERHASQPGGRRADAHPAG